MVEPAVRRVAAEFLGVASDALQRDVSLTDDLAADSLDLAELALVLEQELGIAIPDRTVQSLRTYGDLVDAVAARLVALPQDDGAPAVFARSRVIPADDAARGRVERFGELTPYDAELIADDALRAGPGARVEMEVAATTTDSGIAAAFRRLSRLPARGIGVSVRRDRQPSASRRR